MNAINYTIETYNEFDKEYHITNRVIGLAQLAGGVTEEVVGATGVLAPEPATTVGGAALMIHGADNIWAGLQTIYTGENIDNLTHQGVKSAVQQTGVSENNAELIAVGVECVAGCAFSCSLPKSSNLRKFVAEPRYDIEINGEKHHVSYDVSTRYVKMLHNNVGVNISAETDFAKYTEMGKTATFITDPESIAFLGKCAQKSSKVTIGFARKNNQITYMDLFILRRKLGLNAYMKMRKEKIYPLIWLCLFLDFLRI